MSVDYSLDYGKLAYGKAEELAKRIAFLEGTQGSSSFATLSFVSNERTDAIGGLVVLGPFLIETKMSTSVRIGFRAETESSEGIGTLTLLVDGVSAEQQRVLLGNGTGILDTEFVLSGCPQGKVEISFSLTDVSSVSAFRAYVEGASLAYGEELGKLQAVRLGERIFTAVKVKEGVCLSVRDKDGKTEGEIVRLGARDFALSLCNNEKVVVFFVVTNLGDVIARIIDENGIFSTREFVVESGVTCVSACAAFDGICLAVQKDGTFVLEGKMEGEDLSFLAPERVNVGVGKPKALSLFCDAEGFPVLGVENTFGKCFVSLPVHHMRGRETYGVQITFSVS